MNQSSLLEQRLQEKVDAGKRGASPGDLFVIEDALMFMALAAQSLSQDEFSKCFEPKPRVIEPGFWYFLWCLGVFIRYFFLLPLRLFILLTGLGVALVALCGARLLGKREAERWLLTMGCRIWLFSYGAVIRHHGKKPQPSSDRPHLFVANHTSFTDFLVLSSHECPHGVVAQSHGGLFGLFMRYILEMYGSVSFNRNEQRDRLKVAEKIKRHISNPQQFASLLVFPEGTCVNNESTVLFHKGVFELGCAICPVGIKYNKKLLDPYWNTREQSFSQHVIYLMTRWLMMVDVYWLPPCERKLGETPIEFADRVKAAISHATGLKNRSWNGYLKNVMRALDRERMQKSSQSKYAGYLKVVNMSSESVNRMGTSSGNSSSHESTAAPISISQVDHQDAANYSHSLNITRRSAPHLYSHSLQTPPEFPQWLTEAAIIDAKNSLLLSGTAGISTTSAQLSSLKESLVAQCAINEAAEAEEESGCISEDEHS